MLAVEQIVLAKHETLQKFCGGETNEQGNMKLFHVGQTNIGQQRWAFRDIETRPEVQSTMDRVIMTSLILEKQLQTETTRNLPNFNDDKIAQLLINNVDNS